MDVRMFRIMGTSHRLLLSETPGDIGTQPDHHFELISFCQAPPASEVLPGLRRLAANLCSNRGPAHAMLRLAHLLDDEAEGYAATLEVGATGGANWRLRKGHDAERQSALGTLVIRRDRQVAKLHLSRAERFTCGFSGNLGEILLLVRLAGLERLSGGWRYTKLVEEPVRFAPTAVRPVGRQSLG